MQVGEGQVAGEWSDMTGNGGQVAMNRGQAMWPCLSPSWYLSSCCLPPPPPPRLSRTSLEYVPHHLVPVAIWPPSHLSSHACAHWTFPPCCACTPWHLSASHHLLSHLLSLLPYPHTASLLLPDPCWCLQLLPFCCLSSCCSSNSAGIPFWPEAGTQSICCLLHQPCYAEAIAVMMDLLLALKLGPEPDLLLNTWAGAAGSTWFVLLASGPQPEVQLEGKWWGGSCGSGITGEAGWRHGKEAAVGRYGLGRIFGGQGAWGELCLTPGSEFCMWATVSVPLSLYSNRSWVAFFPHVEWGGGSNNYNV